MLQWFRGIRLKRCISVSLQRDRGFMKAPRRHFSHVAAKGVPTSCWSSDSTSIEEHRGAGLCVHTPSLPHTHTRPQTGRCVCALQQRSERFSASGATAATPQSGPGLNQALLCTWARCADCSSTHDFIFAALTQNVAPTLGKFGIVFPAVLTLTYKLA